MKTYKMENYGQPDKVLKLVEVERPQPKANEVLVKICATSINDYEWGLVRGRPFVYRLFLGLLKPRKKLSIPGMELAGIVEKTGSKATKFRAGDEVYGDISNFGFGSFAEFLCIDERALALKPQNMSFEEATSIPHAAMLALQGLRDIGKIKDNQEILINGGGGGVGFFGIQLAKLYNTKVTGVDTGEKLKKMQDQGYDIVLDYKKDDFTQNDEKYDLIFDCKTNRSLWKYLKVLEPEGKYVSIGGSPGKLSQMLFMIPILKLFSRKRLYMLFLKANHDLEYISKLYEKNKIHCVIDGPYPFEKIPWAIQRFGCGLHTGKIVISFSVRQKT